jgi:glycine betaine/choline ABC-type transport system substrate-binding protein
MYRINGTNQTIAESQLKTLGDEINVFPDYNGQRLVFTSDANLRT